MAQARFVRRPAGFVEVLLSPEVAAELQRRAEAIASAAQSDPSWDHLVSGTPGDEVVPYRARVARYGDRNVAQVSGDHPAALAVEAKHRVLGRALDAGR